MNNVLRIMLGISFLISAATSTELVLQQGLDDYSGCQDVSLYKDYKSEDHVKYPGFTGTPNDTFLVFSRLVC